MAFQNGSYAKIKEVERKDNCTKCKIVISRKIKGTEKYVCDFAGWVSFIGDAHRCNPIAGQRIKIGSCMASNGYLDKDGNQKFGKTIQLSVFSYELQSDAGSSSYPDANDASWIDIPSDSELPF